jgi:hypothetical protein
VLGVVAMSGLGACSSGSNVDPAVDDPAATSTTSPIIGPIDRATEVVDDLNARLRQEDVRPSLDDSTLP